MRAWNYHRPAGTRPIAAGLLIALAGPPLGLCTIIFWFAIGQGEFSLGPVPMSEALPVSYLVGGVQALIAGVIVGWVIHRHGWVSLGAWIVLTIILGLPAIVLYLLIRDHRGNGGLLYMPDFKIACYLMAAAIFASLVLRVVVIALGWMRR